MAVATEQALPAAIGAASKDIAWIELLPGSERRGLARASANFYGHPADALKLVGVTGTNGKTTTAFLVDSILQAAGSTTGLIGTTGYRTPAGSRPAVNTTPESLDLQQMFAEIRDAGGTHAVLEASSHALAMERLWGCHFAVAIFTNLTRDHLDYHKTFEEYFAAKRLLFEGTGAGAPDVAVINADDPYAVAAGGSRAAHDDVRAADCCRPDDEEILAELSAAWNSRRKRPPGNIEVRSPLVGRINIYNILGGDWRGDRARDSKRRKSKRASRIWSWFPDDFSASTRASRFW